MKLNDLHPTYKGHNENDQQTERLMGGGGETRRNKQNNIRVQMHTSATTLENKTITTLSASLFHGLLYLIM